MNRCLLFFGCLSLMMTWSSCVSNVEEELYPPDDCDTVSVTYSLVVEPIIANNCYACHSALAPTSGIPLEGYPNLKAQVDNERLIGAIRHESGYSPMPQNAPALSECSLLKIEKWVAEGAQDN